MLCAQVLRVLSRQDGESERSELPYALRRSQRPAAPSMDALGLARHLAVSDVQVCKILPARTHLLPIAARCIGMYTWEVVGSL